MTPTPDPAASALPRDLSAGLVVFLVALPLCLGVALASGAPPLAGLLAGVVGGLVVGNLSGSHTSVSGPSPGLTAVVAVQVAALGFEGFLLAVFVAGLLQIALGVARAGFVAAFVPSAVVKGLLAAVGVILVLKQIPHVFGHDPDPEGDFAFQQPNQRNTFSELAAVLGDIEPGAAAIGLLSVGLLIVWARWKWLKNSPLPAPLAVVILGIVGARLFHSIGEPWLIPPGHLVQVPTAKGVADFFASLPTPDFGQRTNPAVYAGAFAVAAAASLETLLNLEAVDKIDPQRRASPPSRELIAQGVGNVVSGLVGGLPVSSAIVRSSVNLQAGARSKWSAVAHGLLLLVSVALLPAWLNEIPLSCLAAVLLVTGARLAGPQLVKQMWAGGRSQFAPFAVTVAAIVFTDLITGVLIGLAVSVGFILWSNARKPPHSVVEKHPGGDVTRIELADQVSFLNRAALSRALDEVPRGGHVLLDARGSDYIDPDILGLVREFQDLTGPARGVTVSLLGFRRRYDLRDRIRYPDYASRELQSSLTPEQVLRILKDGHERFRTGQRLTRDLGRQVLATAEGQHPMAVVLGCIDSRAPAELIFDLGLGDIFVVRVAGNVTGDKVLGSVEYACAVAGAKLILVVGHTRCGAVGAAVKLMGSTKPAAEATGCQHIDPIIDEIRKVIESAAGVPDAANREAFVDEVARRNVTRSVEAMTGRSETIAGLVRQGKVAVAGAMYDVVTGDLEFLSLSDSEAGGELVNPIQHPTSRS